ncbi:MAG: hypothetical protein R2799_14940, partial [Crocinitomicaceae bacterium]
MKRILKEYDLKMAKSNKFKIKKTHNIGSPDAETDDDLFEVFVDIENLELILDTKSQKSILIGRTGSGKSAIIRYLKENCESIQGINPESMSLRFLSNSTILNYFKSLGINLNLFYKVLWKHVFVVELMKLYFDEADSQKKASIFQGLIDKIQGSKVKKTAQKQRVVEYMKNWTDDFWNKTEYRIQKLEKTIQKEFANSMGMNLEALQLKISEGSSESEKILIEAKNKAESIIHATQANELMDIIEILKEDFFCDHQKKYFIVIDDLDKEWIGDEIRYDLIGSMIEVIKEFRQFKGVKIVISLRENLNEMVFSGIKNKGGQREKFKPMFSNIEWSEEELEILLDNRLKRLSENQLNVKNAFYKSRRGKNTGIDYVLERTFHRPRDIISFVNHALENANNKEYFTSDILSKAEPSYSLDRFHALEDEWSENYGRLGKITEFLRGIQNGFKLKSLNEDQFAEAYVIE